MARKWINFFFFFFFMLRTIIYEYITQIILHNLCHLIYFFFYRIFWSLSLSVEFTWFFKSNVRILKFENNFTLIIYQLSLTISQLKKRNVIAYVAIFNWSVIFCVEKFLCRDNPWDRGVWGFEFQEERELINLGCIGWTDCICPSPLSITLHFLFKVAPASIIKVRSS